jgi:hypothetical protein
VTASNEQLEISGKYLRHVVERLESFRSHPLGFRVAGTPEERQATAFAADELRDAGLTDVVEEPVPVDAWRLQDAFVELAIAIDVCTTEDPSLRRTDATQSPRHRAACLLA